MCKVENTSGIKSFCHKMVILAEKMKQNSCKTSKDAKYMENITRVKPRFVQSLTCFDDVQSK